MFLLFSNMLLSQCCSCRHYVEGKAAYIWYTWVCSLCCGFNNYCTSCPSGAHNWICSRSVGSCYWTRYPPFLPYQLLSNISVRANVISFGLAAFLSYAAIVLAATFVLIYYFIPRYGQTHIMVYIGVCSLVGSLSVCVLHIHLALVLSICICVSDYALILFPFKMCWCWQVMSVKALGIALKLTFSGMNQLIYPQTWLFTIVVVACIVTQMNYLNKVILNYWFFILLMDSPMVCIYSEYWVQQLLLRHMFFHVLHGSKWHCAGRNAGYTHAYWTFACYMSHNELSMWNYNAYCEFIILGPLSSLILGYLDHLLLL